MHLVGAGGAGMSALARLYLALGHTVSGSDASDSPALRDLAALGAAVHVGHDGRYVQGADLVVTTSAAPAQTPELVAARAQGIRLLKHAQALGELFNAQRGIAVAGTHGKTTTTAMIAFVLQRCGLEPKFQVGGELVDLGTSAGWGEGQWMVIEADEFDRRFLEYRPEIAVVTNVEPDHFEYFGSVAEMEGAFRDYLRNVLPGGAVVACAQEPRLATLLEEVNGRRIVRYGVPAAGSQPGPEWDWWASDVVLEPGGSRWTANKRAGQALITLRLQGRHNVLNALAALAVCDLAGVPLERAAPALGAFHGTRRRFQLAGSAAGVRVYEDYAHHPTEVRVNLEAARLLVPPGGRLWGVFQPHLYQRTEGLFEEFRGAFQAADQALLTDVYSPQGREPARAYRGTSELVAAMAAAGHPGARHVPDAAAARATLNAETRPGDVVVVMGAGPINALAYDLAGDLAARAPAPQGAST
ncbi:MAG TPA: UDP-N-acetylmuramate--L-alanine ligase [Chloroflexota bacterium]|nr:UDP-N-acetylmuramate--L-alanine ligase [Chloroflexota bacterium]